VNLLFGLLFMLQTTAAPTQAPKPTIDRNAFTFTEYRLQATLDPAKHVIVVAGDVTLRNDSEKPQDSATLQISSSLEWKTIRLADTVAKYSTQKVVSDIDHTGAVSEARVTTSPVAPKGSITLHVAYAGMVELGSGRLHRLGTPQTIAEQNDWDRIGADIIALRGVGYITWYPVSIEPALLSDGNTVFERIAQWRGRHQQSSMTLTLRGTTGTVVSSADQASGEGTILTWRNFGIDTPTFVIAAYQRSATRNGDVFGLQASADTAQRYAKIFDELQPIADARPRNPQRVAQLPASFSAFEAKNLLVTPFSDRTTDAVVNFNLLHTAAHAYFVSDRPWLNEGFAHWAQLRSVNHASGRKAALAMLQDRESGLALADSSEHDPQPLTSAYDEIFYRTKATYVWWMLADMVGDDKLLAAVRAYVPAQDREPSYFQRLVENESGKGLEQFFDDWVYRDKGLPEFKITDFYSRQNLNGGMMVTVTIENSGTAGAEVPLTAHAKAVENSARVWVPAKSKASARLVMPLLPNDVVVNDGSVPEIDPTDNVYTVAPNPSPK
jgi:Peptidase family M1 domain